MSSPWAIARWTPPSPTLLTFRVPPCPVAMMPSLGPSASTSLQQRCLPGSTGGAPYLILTVLSTKWFRPLRREPSSIYPMSYSCSRRLQPPLC